MIESFLQSDNVGFRGKPEHGKHSAEVLVVNFSRAEWIMTLIGAEKSSVLLGMKCKIAKCYLWN